MSTPKTSILMTELSVNDNAFNAVISEIKSNSESSIPQPVMIIGQSGAGKTTLLKRIYDSDKCEGKSKVWINGRTVFCSQDIISKVENPKNSILFIDDIDFFLTRCSYEEQFRLRKFLYNEGAPMMISTVSKILPALTEYEAPFFEGLKNIYIDPISSDNISRLFNKQETRRADILMNLLPPTIRSLQTVYSIIKLNKFPEGDISMLISMFSEKYNDLYNRLPPYSQHILNALGTVNDGMIIPEIRESTGLQTNILTAYLNSLKKNGIINIDKSIKKNARYSIKDPLFKSWINTIL